MKKILQTALILAAILLLSSLCTAAAAEDAEQEEPQRISAEPCSPVYLTAYEPAECALSEADYRKAYEILLSAAQNAETFAELGSLQVSTADANTLFQAVRSENPELFYLVSAWFWLSGDSVYRMELVYDEDGLDAKADFDAKVESILGSCIREGMSDPEKALVLHDYLVDNCAYVWDIPSDPLDHVYDAYGALMNEVAVCNGYALAYRLLLNKVGIENDLALSNSMNHIWNLLCIDGAWYHVDVTWDDPTPDQPGWGSYDFFLLSDATIGDADHGHYGWDSQGHSCSSMKYESGHLFNGAADLLYYHNGQYYAIRSDGVLYTGDLNSTGEKVCDMPDTTTYYGYPTALADGGAIYLPLLDCEWVSYSEMAWYLSIGRLDLESGEYAVISETVEFVPTASPDGKYQSVCDGVGLRFSEDGSTVEAVSNTRRTVLLSAETRQYPVAWDNTVLEDGEHIRAAGVHVEGDTVLAGVLTDESVTRPLKVYAVFYDGGRMVTMLAAAAEPEAGGMLLCRWDAAQPADWDSVRLFVMGGSFAPAGGMWSSAA